MAPHDSREDDARPLVRGEDGDEEAGAAFPWPAVVAAASLVLLHLAVVFWSWSPLPPGRELLRWGGLLRGATLAEPWRLVTSLVLHSSPSHALWNGLSMTVFAVPLIADVGLARTGSIYLIAGLGGGLAALAFTDPGVYVVGSSGAVAGLFGAWVVLQLRSARLAASGWRVRVRALGIALLVLPSLVSPTTAAGRAISVSSHLGGMATGMAIGAVLSLGLLARRRDPTASSPDRSSAGR